MGTSSILVLFSSLAYFAAAGCGAAVPTAPRCKINHGRHFGVVWTGALWQTAVADGTSMHVMQIMKLL